MIKNRDKWFEHGRLVLTMAYMVTFFKIAFLHEQQTGDINFEVALYNRDSIFILKGHQDCAYIETIYFSWWGQCSIS